MKRILLSVALGAGFAAGTLSSPSGAAADAVVYPPNPYLGTPLSVLVVQGSETEANPLVIVGINPGPPGMDPDRVIITPGLSIGP